MRSAGLFTPSPSTDGGWEDIFLLEGARKAIDRIRAERPGVGPSTPLFPSPKDRTKSIRYELASAWLKQAEKAAGLPKQKGGLWHPYRRGWATARKGLPSQDVAAMGGWSSTAVLEQVYQQADQQGMLAVVTTAAELREAR